MLEGKVALVTGSSRGIGREIAIEMAKAGAVLTINYLSNEEKAREVKDEILALGGQAIIIQADISQEEAAENLIKMVVNEYGKIDILVNNAGITQDNLLLRMKAKEWQKVLDANLTGPFNCTKFALKSMLRQKSGRIINISSVVGISGNPGQGNYAAAKAGLIGFTKTLAKEVASRNILVNAIAPGFIDTDMTGALTEKDREALLSTIPLGRFGKPKEIATTAVFLASEGASYITGQTIVVDGGMIV